VFSGNGGDGFFAVVYADDGAANVRAIQSVFTDNSGDGLEASVGTGSGSIVINLGKSAGGGGFNQGSNSIFGNGGFGVNNTGSGVGTIEDNFWGGGAPVGGTDYNVGGWTAPSTFKATDPNP